LQKLLFSVLAGIFLFGIIGNSQLVYGEKFVIDDYDFELTGAFSEIFSFELFPGAYGGTGMEVMGFTDEYDTEDWTFGTDGNGTLIDNSPDSISINGSNVSGLCGLLSECLTSFEIEVPCEGDITFGWTYSTLDSGGPEFDPLFFVLNAAITQLTDDGGLDDQSGTELVPVNVADIFGWVIDSTDDSAGGSMVTIDMFSAPWCLKNGKPVGGEPIALDTTMVLVAGTQSTAAWMIPVIVSAIGIAIVIARKF